MNIDRLNIAERINTYCRFAWGNSPKIDKDSLHLHFHMKKTGLLKSSCNKINTTVHK